MVRAMEYPALFLVVAQVSGKCSSDVAVGGVPNVGHPPAPMLAVAEAPQACSPDVVVGGAFAVVYLPASLLVVSEVSEKYSSDVAVGVPNGAHPPTPILAVVEIVVLGESSAPM